MNGCSLQWLKNKQMYKKTVIAGSDEFRKFAVFLVKLKVRGSYFLKGKLDRISVYLFDAPIVCSKPPFFGEQIWHRLTDPPVISND